MHSFSRALEVQGTPAVSHRRRRGIAVAGAISAAAVLAAATPASAADIRSIISSTGSGQVVSVGSGTYAFANFAASKIGLDITGKGGLKGAGTGSTVLEMTTRSSTMSKYAPTDSGSNSLYLMKANGSPVLSGFTLQGTTQGHLYNGLEISSATNAQVSNIAVKAVPGAGYNPPAETFSINDQKSTGSVYSGIQENGSGVGAVGLAANSSTNVTVKNSTFTNNPYSAGVTFWQTKNVTLTNVVSTDNRTGMNFERCSGTITITKPTILNESNQDFYIGSDQGGVKIVITDPVYSGHLRIRIPAKYRGVTNQVTKSDVTVLVGGVNKTSSVVTWI